ncbi:MAG: TonB-dependent receptor plug domain-containing protein, partial [Tannerella sp.]|nr:TonB-dependent receptor plug domain-containing protein [Tannerella sp.]
MKNARLERHVKIMMLSAFLLLTGTGMAGARDGYSSETADPAQSKIRITGTVVDQAGEPVIGANILEKGVIANGTITDVDGKFGLDVSSGATLVVSFIGYVTQEIAPGNRTQLQIILQEDAQALEEVVVVGYGTQKKANLTGAVATVSLPEMEKRTVAQTSLALTGLVPGVVVTQRSGKPGGDGGIISVRGKTTLGNNDVLVLIDGVESNINSIDSKSIESISVLKDAASAAIYGNRAANGVILITTKRAEDGKAYISYNGYVAQG